MEASCSTGGGESGWITQHPTQPDIFYAGSQGALLTRYNRSNGQIRDMPPNDYIAARKFLDGLAAESRSS